MTISDKPAASLAFLFVPGKSAKRDKRLGCGRLSLSLGFHFQEKVPIFRRRKLATKSSVKDKAERLGIGSPGPRVEEQYTRGLFISCRVNRPRALRERLRCGPREAEHAGAQET
jgi:hypothetical protein